MPSEQLSDRLIQIAEEILIKEIIDEEKKYGLVKLAMFCRYQVNWRLQVHSNDAIAEVWSRLETLATVKVNDREVEGIRETVVAQMVNEWVFRTARLLSNDYQSGIPVVVDALIWPGASESLPEAFRTFTPTTPEEIIDRLKKNPWVVFFFIIGMSDAIKLIENYQVKERK